MHTPTKGQFLIAEPYLQDPNFGRSVVLIVSNETGHTGLVLNKISEVKLSEVLTLDNADHIPIYIGGPVAPDTLHFIHRRPDLVDESIEVAENIYWGGNFEQVKSIIEHSSLDNRDFQFFIGYSGWSPHQLYQEMELKSWFVSDADEQLIFETQPDELWQETLKKMGGPYEWLINSPENPQWN